MPVARLAQRGGDQFLGVAALDAVEQLLGLQRRVAEVDQAVAGEAAGIAPSASPAADLLLERPGDLLAQLDDDPLRGALADPGHGLEAFGVAGGDRSQQLARGAAGERRDGDLRADPADRDQLAEEVALLLGGEAVEGERVVAGDQLGVQEGVAPGGRDRFQRLGRDGEPVADAAGVDHDVIGPAHQHLAADRGDHPASLLRGTSADRSTPPAAGAPPWQIATASASAAWSGARRLGQARAGCRPSAAPVSCRPPRAADRHLDRLRRVGEAGTPRCAAASIAAPLAWPTAIAERTFLPK